jgi:hypothetical protein
VYEQLINDTNVIIELANIPLNGYMPVKKDLKGLGKSSIDISISPESNLQGSAYASLEYGIFLNGIGSDGHETFALAPPNPTPDGYSGWWLGDTASGGNGFCKTARKPYDIIVCAVLCRAKMLMGDCFVFRYAYCFFSFLRRSMSWE